MLLVSYAFKTFGLVALTSQKAHTALAALSLQDFNKPQYLLVKIRQDFKSILLFKILTDFKPSFVSLLFPMRRQKAHTALSAFCFPFVSQRETIRNNQK